MMHPSVSVGYQQVAISSEELSECVHAIIGADCTDAAEKMLQYPAHN